MKLALEKIISGGQTGVDQAALRAAHKLGLQTGGWAPHGWRTLDGEAPWLAEYELREHPGGYPARTVANVQESCATVRIARHFFTQGERCTISAILRLKRPHLDIHADRLDLSAASELIAFLIAHRVRVLNIAGNSERTAPGIGDAVEKFLVGALSVNLLR